MSERSTTTSRTRAIDHLDARLIAELRQSPRIGVMELARRLGVARGTAQARIDKLRRHGVVVGFGPDIDLAALGYPVMAFATLEVAQGRTAGIVDRLAAIPQVLEAHSIAGNGDLLVRIAAPSNEELFEVLEILLEFPEIRRTSTAIALAEHIPYRVDPLIATFDELPPQP